MSEEVSAAQNSIPMKRRVLRSLWLSVWVVVGFYSANLLIGIIFAILSELNLINIRELIDSPVFITSLTAAVFALTFAIVVGVPYVLRGSRTTKAEVGLSRFPVWSDILWAPVSFIVYSLIAAIVLIAITIAIPSFDADEVQEIGFDNLRSYADYILAFIALVIIAPVAEEILFRGYLYGKLRKYIPIVGAVIISSILFAALHLNFDINFDSPESGGFNLGDLNIAISQWNVALNVLPLAIILVILREKTGSIWSSILLHAIKNGVAFYVLFINPSVLNTIGG